MMTINWRDDLRRRLEPLKLSPAREAEIVDELTAHLDDRYREHLAAGRTPAEARRLALDEIDTLTGDDALARRLAPLERKFTAEAPAFGSPARRAFLRGLWQDVRYGLRTLRKNPGFAFIAILMMAVGAGANAAMFSVVDAAMLSSPYRDPARMVLLSELRNGSMATLNVRPGQVRELPGVTEVLDGLSGYASPNPVLSGTSEQRRLRVECVNADMFRVLGVSPMRGRAFGPGDDRPGADPVVVVGYRFWQRELAGAEDAVGKTLRLNGVPVTIVGIMGPEYDGVRLLTVADALAPLGAGGVGNNTPTGCRSDSGVNVYGRLKAGLSLSAARARLDTLSQGALGLMLFSDSTLGDDRTMLLALSGAVVFVLLIACANVANLLVERATGRSREIAVRRALGATPRRLMQQMLTESVLVAVLGGLAGLAAAWLTLDLLVSIMPPGVPRITRIAMNGRVLGVTLAASVTAGLLAGLLPAFQARVQILDALRDGRAATQSGGPWMRRALVVTELALAVALVTGAGLMLSSFLALRPTRPGFESAHRMFATISIAGPRYDSEAPRLEFFDQLFKDLRAIPGVADVTGTSYAPMSGHVSDAAVVIDSRPETRNGKTRVFMPLVTANYFSSMGIAVRAGRAFTERDDRAAEPVAMVNEAMVRRFWPDRMPLGEAITVRFWPSDPAITRRIVGVAADTRTFGNDTRTRAELFVPFAQLPYTIMDVLIRTDGPPPPDLPRAIRSAVGRVDPTQAAGRIELMDDILTRSVSSWRFVTVLLTTFAVMGVGLAVVGLAAMVAWSVTRRTREIGVRLALGASPVAVVRLMLRQVIVLAAVGVLLGLGLAALTTRLLSQWLYGVTALDRTTYLACAALMFLVAVVAGYLPARRASRVDPLIALRAE